MIIYLCEEVNAYFSCRLRSELVHIVQDYKISIAFKDFEVQTYPIITLQKV